MVLCIKLEGNLQWRKRCFNVDFLVFVFWKKIMMFTGRVNKTLWSLGFYGEKPNPTHLEPPRRRHRHHFLLILISGVVRCSSFFVFFFFSLNVCSSSMQNQEKFLALPPIQLYYWYISQLFSCLDSKFASLSSFFSFWTSWLLTLLIFPWRLRFY